MTSSFLVEVSSLSVCYRPLLSGVQGCEMQDSNQIPSRWSTVYFGYITSARYHCPTHCRHTNAKVYLYRSHYTILWLYSTVLRHYLAVVHVIIGDICGFQLPTLGIQTLFKYFSFVGGLIYWRYHKARSWRPKLLQLLLKLIVDAFSWDQLK